jgi:hypothetical protein
MAKRKSRGFRTFNGGVFKSRTGKSVKEWLYSRPLVDERERTQAG